MKINEYQKLAYVTANKDLSTLEQMENAVMGMAGEAGEAIDLIKKWKFQGHSLDVEHLTKEIGDVCWYIALACTALGVDLETVMKQNIEKLKARYPEGFEAELSKHRKEGDI